ncbi:MAG: hypothetical protein JSR59_18205 [Proteobacteria bacterium]|nr:hypothetical protein [Pseudomonadota bacterium]
MRAEDALPDQLNAATIEGVTIRKGTIAAFLANAKVVADARSDPAARAVAERDIADALPALRAIGLFDVLAVRDARVRALVESGSTVVGAAA